MAGRDVEQRFRQTVDTFIERAETEAERTKLQRFRDAGLSLGRDFLVQFGANVASGGVTGGLG